MKFKIIKTEKPKQKPNDDSLQFGREFTDHMFVMEYSKDKGWHDGKIVPYGPIELEPSASVFHYGQEMFEGLKAYRTKEEKILLFRPDMNAKRSNKTCNRLCIPEIDEELYGKAIKALVEVEKEWVPKKEGTSLYIRPFIIGTQPYLGVSPSETYKFIIILSPVGQYYSGGLAPTSIYVEEKYVRSVAGGTGEAKYGGNYAAGLKAQMEAFSKGYDQILWLDGIERKYIEEIGTSNAFFVFGEEIVTPPTLGTILEGVTRNSVIHLLKSNGYKVTERKITIDEVLEGVENGKITEMFATGTAAVISPVGELSYKGKVVKIADKKIGEITQMVYDDLYGIQAGKKADPFGWVVEIQK